MGGGDGAYEVPLIDARGGGEAHSAFTSVISTLGRTRSEQSMPERLYAAYDGPPFLAPSPPAGLAEPLECR